MASDKSQLWTRFFNCEKAMFDYINTSCRVLNTVVDCEPEYKKVSEINGLEVTKAPPYIRCVAILPDGGAQFDSLYEDMVECLLAARKADGQKSERLPNRFPVRYDDIASITTRTDRAIKSYTINANEDVVLDKTMIFDTKGMDALEQSYKSSVDTLKSHGFVSAEVKEYLTKSHYGQTPTMAIVINSNDLFEKYGAVNIQARVETGKRYRATIRKKGETRGKEATYGFIVLDKDSDPVMNAASSNPPRPHRIEETAIKIELPIDSETSFFIKEDVVQ